jgi:hypothetical protein
MEGRAKTLRQEMAIVNLVGAGWHEGTEAEVAHEQLLKRWPTLENWLNNQREFLVWRGEVERDARTYYDTPDVGAAYGAQIGHRSIVVRPA